MYTEAYLKSAKLALGEGRAMPRIANPNSPAPSTANSPSNPALTPMVAATPAMISAAARLEIAITTRVA